MLPNVKEALAWCDVANVLRIQLERQNMPLFSSLREYALYYGIDKKLFRFITKRNRHYTVLAPSIEGWS